VVFGVLKRANDRQVKIGDLWFCTTLNRPPRFIRGRPGFCCNLGWIVAWRQTRHIVPKLKKSNVSLAPPLFVWILCVSFLNTNVFDMYGVQTPVVSAPLMPKAPLNAYIWRRKFEAYNSVQYLDIIFVPCKFFSLNLSKHVRNWRDIATSTHEIAIFSKMNVSKSQTHVFWIRQDPIRFHQFDVSSDVIVIIHSESSWRRILKTSEIWMADKKRNLCCWLLSALFLTRMSTVCHARKITATYLLLSVVHVFPLFWITRTYTTLYSITTGLQISLKTTTIFFLIDTTRIIFLYKFWSWNRLELTSNISSVRRQLFGIWCTNFDL
jgi:hypothetical protein